MPRAATLPRITAADTTTKLEASHRSGVVIAASHGGVCAGYCAAQGGARGGAFNDASWPAPQPWEGWALVVLSDPLEYRPELDPGGARFGAADFTRLLPGSPEIDD